MLRERGFTLIELALVMGVMSISALVAVAGMSQYRRVAFTQEATANITVIRSLLFSSRVEAQPCGPWPAEIPSRSMVAWEPLECFDTIGFRPAVGVRYQYEVVLNPTSELDWIVVARGDLDGDGVTSEFRAFPNAAGYFQSQYTE